MKIATPFSWDAMNMDWDSLSQMEIPLLSPAPLRGPPGSTADTELCSSALVSVGEQTPPSDCTCSVHIWAALGIWAYLPPDPVFSFSDSFLCSHTLLILSHRFRPGPVEKSGNKDTSPATKQYFLHISLLSELELPWVESVLVNACVERVDILMLLYRWTFQKALG